MGAIRRIDWSHDGTIIVAIIPGGSYTPAYAAAKKADTVGEYLEYAVYADIRSGINARGLAFNFGRSITVHRVVYWNTYNAVITLQYSNDSTTGVDGAWTTLYGPTAAGYSTTINIGSPTAGTWFRFYRESSEWYNSLYAFHIYGEDNDSLFELWDSSGSAILADYADVNLAAAYSSTDYSETTTFKIKNIDTVAHTYTVTIAPVRYAGDTFMVDHFKISDDGSTKVTTFDVPSVSADSFSGVITLHGDILAVDNISPYDRRAYKISVEQTS